MYKNKRILAFVPARIGSKRVQKKNIKIIGDKPLFQHSVDVAKKSEYIDDVLVSSDSIEILSIAHELGCLKNTLRPDYLSSDNSRIIDSMLYEIKENKLNYDVMVLLQPTFPIRTPKLLDSAIEKYFESETSLITVTKVTEQPVFFRRIVNGVLKKIIAESSDIRSQDFNEYYKIIGCIYINNMNLLTEETVLNENLIPFIIDEKYCIDIDTENDFENAKRVIEGI